MAKKIAYSTLNASTLDILNVIRENASLEYQSAVPAVEKSADIPAVGEIIYGTPALANQFLNALVNRIAFVRVQSATFNNPYKNLKKGYVEFGESIENIFVNIASVEEYTPEKGPEREFKRTLPDVRSVFHVMNWRTLYPVTIQDEDLRLAFLSLDGVTDLIAKIVDQVYTAAEYDEFLLFKYLIIKGINGGAIIPEGINVSNINDAAVAFRGLSNKLPFMSSAYNAAGVKTTTPKDRQVIFMDADFNAKYDVEVLAAAFNMDKAEFMGKLYLIDDFTTFDNDRFATITANSSQIEGVTDAELAVMADVQAVLLDENWFQVYDNNNKFTEKYVASGLYWNYFYHTWKTVAYSPFANAVAFVDTSGDDTAGETVLLTPAEELTLTITDKDIEADVGTVLTLKASYKVDNVTVGTGTQSVDVNPEDVEFVYSSDLITENTGAIAVQKYGVYIIPDSMSAVTFKPVVNYKGVTYTATTGISSASNVTEFVKATTTGAQ